MLYFANPTGNRQVHDAMLTKTLGFIDTPRQRNRRPDGVIWCADNGCYGKGFNEHAWWQWLQDNAHAATTCVFATAPDVVGDATATLKRSLPWLPRIRSLGYPAAFVAQDGIDEIEIPWDEFDVLFLGGTDDFKLGPQARWAAAEAKQHGKWLHCGRVNSLRRMRYAEAIGCDSVDGTYLTFGPDVNLARLLGWVTELRQQPVLFGWEELL